MKGNVIGFDADADAGAIGGHDGQRYDFALSDWHGQSRPKHGDLVDFVAENQHAAQIFLIAPEYIAPGFAQFYFSPTGRISRSQYWLKYIVPVFAIEIVLDLLRFIGMPGMQILPSAARTFIGGVVILSVPFQLGVLWSGIALLVKRIHDRNKSGWLVWVLYGPSILAMIVSLAAVIFMAVGVATAASLGILSGVLWVAVIAVAIWFFVEFGCMRGTVGANRYGADPVPGN